MASRSGRGFTLAEVLLAVGTMVLVILTILALVISLNRGSRKSVDLAAAHLVADQVISTIVERAQLEPTHTAANTFWTTPTPVAGITRIVGSVNSNRTEFSYQLDATTVTDLSNGGAPVGGTVLPYNRVKMVTVEVYWWSPVPSPAQQRAGYGKLSVQAMRLINEKRI